MTNTTSSRQHSGLLKNWKCVLICACMSLATTQYGFDAGVLASFQAMRGFLRVFGFPDASQPSGFGIDPVAQQLITSFLNVGTIVGVLFMGPFGRRFGRRAGIWAGSVICFAGCAVQIGAYTIAQICVGRGLVGVANAFFITFSNSFIAESSPAHLRTVLSGLFGVTPALGALLGTVVTYLVRNIDNENCYRIALSCLFFIPTIMSVFCFFIPESPRWLLIRGRPLDAEKALARLRGNAVTEAEMAEEFVEMVRGIEEEKALARRGSYAAMFRGTNRRRTVICVASITSRAASGLWVFISYGVSLDARTQRKAKVYTILTRS